MGAENTTSAIDYTDILKEISHKLSSKDQFIRQCAMNLYTNYLPMRESMPNGKSDKEIAKACIKSANILASLFYE